MKKILVSLLLIFIGAGGFAWYTYAEKSASYPSPKEAVWAMDDTDLAAQKILEVVEMDRKSYVFYTFKFPDSNDDILSTAIVSATKYGWKLQEVLPVGPILVGNVGVFVYAHETIVGFVEKGTQSVSANGETGNIINLKNDDVAAFIVAPIELEDGESFDVEYE